VSDVRWGGAASRGAAPASGSRILSASAADALLAATARVAPASLSASASSSTAAAAAAAAAGRSMSARSGVLAIPAALRPLPADAVVVAGAGPRMAPQPVTQPLPATQARPLSAGRQSGGLAVRERPGYPQAPPPPPAQAQLYQPPAYPQQPYGQQSYGPQGEVRRTTTPQPVHPLARSAPPYTIGTPLSLCPLRHLLLSLASLAYPPTAANASAGSQSLASWAASELARAPPSDRTLFYLTLTAESGVSDAVVVLVVRVVHAGMAAGARRQAAPVMMGAPSAMRMSACPLSEVALSPSLCLYLVVLCGLRLFVSCSSLMGESGQASRVGRYPSTHSQHSARRARAWSRCRRHTTCARPRLTALVRRSVRATAASLCVFMMGFGISSRLLSHWHLSLSPPLTALSVAPEGGGATLPPGFGYTPKYYGGVTLSASVAGVPHTSSPSRPADVASLSRMQDTNAALAARVRVCICSLSLFVCVCVCVYLYRSVCIGLMRSLSLSSSSS
jgi:hypothetical protein